MELSCDFVWRCLWLKLGVHPKQITLRRDTKYKLFQGRELQDVLSCNVFDLSCHIQQVINVATAKKGLQKFEKPGVKLRILIVN